MVTSEIPVITFNYIESNMLRNINMTSDAPSSEVLGHFLTDGIRFIGRTRNAPVGILMNFVRL